VLIGALADEPPANTNPPGEAQEERNATVTAWADHEYNGHDSSPSQKEDHRQYRQTSTGSERENHPPSRLEVIRYLTKQKRGQITAR
jgi:hypothetical protein